MKPSRAFDSARFICLARAQWAEQRRRWAGFMLGQALLYVLILLFLLSTGTGQWGLRTDGQAACYTAGLLVSGFIFAGRYFSDIHRREGNLLLLMQPASTLEKMLLAALVILLLYPLAYTALFELLTWPARHLAFSMAQLNFEKLVSPGVESVRNAPKAADFVAFWPFWPDAKALWQHSFFAVLYVCSCGFALACSLYFGRAALLKTLCLGFGLFLISMMWAAMISPDMDSLLALWQSPWGGQSRSSYAISALLWLGGPALLWLSAYWNLRERQLS